MTTLSMHATSSVPLLASESAAPTVGGASAGSGTADALTPSQGQTKEEQPPHPAIVRMMEGHEALHTVSEDLSAHARFEVAGA